MKRSADALVVVPMLLVIAVMAVLGLWGTAHADPAQQFAVQVVSPQPGDVTVRVLVRRYDTSGLVPPTPTELAMRLPRGVALSRAFLTPRFECDGVALRDALDARPSGTPFNRRVAHLDAFARELARSHARRDRAALANVRACERGRLGGGTGVIDARDAIPVLTDPIPFGFSLFLGRPAAPGAVASFTGLGAADEQAPIVRRYPVVAGVHAVVTENLVSDPTPDGLYGLKLEINTGPINGLQVSIAEIDATVHSLVLRRGSCAARGRTGRCLHRRPEDVPLFTVPRCPPAGHYAAQLLSVYPPPIPAVVTALDVPCPAYVR